MPSLKSILFEAINILQESTESARADAEILLCEVLGKNRSYLSAWPEFELDRKLITEFDKLVNLRQQGQPIAYLTGVREFWSREFLVTPDVLIPRPETELLVELCLTLIPDDNPCNIIDLGTGSGIIAITLAAERPLARVIASEISPAALAIAESNANKHRIHNIQFYQSDWFSHVPPDTFDLIVSNPPYLAEDDPHLLEGDLRFEPTNALIANNKGLAAIEIIAENAASRLKQEGFLLVEQGYNQENQVQHIFKRHNYQNIRTHNDLSGHPRVTVGQHCLNMKEAT